jgi:hypothetical protein
MTRTQKRYESGSDSNPFTNSQTIKPAKAKGLHFLRLFPFFLVTFCFFGLDDLTWCLQHSGSFMHVVFPTPGMMKNGKEMSWNYISIKK